MDYIDRDTAIRTATEMCVKIVGHGITQIDAVNIADAFEDVSTADVVPKSEVEEAEAEIERLKHILDCYALQYGTVKEQQDVIDKANQEVAREIFEEIEKALSENFHADCQMGDCIEDYYDNNLQDNIAELKKKYTEGEE